MKKKNILHNLEKLNVHLREYPSDFTDLNNYLHDHSIEFKNTELMFLIFTILNSIPKENQDRVFLDIKTNLQKILKN